MLVGIIAHSFAALPFSKPLSLITKLEGPSGSSSLPKGAGMPTEAVEEDEEEEQEKEEEDEDALFDAAPDGYKCPISLVLLTDPVVAMDGYTYQRDALEQWIAKSEESKQRRPRSICRKACCSLSPLLTPISFRPSPRPTSTEQRQLLSPQIGVPMDKMFIASHGVRSLVNEYIEKFAAARSKRQSTK